MLRAPGRAVKRDAHTFLGLVGGWGGVFLVGTIVVVV